MVNKQQEREALDKICEILESLGEDSPVAIAFEGVGEYALRNIEYDLTISPREDVKTRTLDLADALTAAAVAKLEITRLKRSNEKLEADFNEVDASLGEEMERAESYRVDNIDLYKRIAAAEAEINQLKARLYDMMAAVSVGTRP